MSTYLDGNKFTDFMAKLDPTSSKIGGKIVKGVLSAAGTLIGIPPTFTMGAFTTVGKITGSIKASAKAAKNPPMQYMEQLPAGYTPGVSMNPYQYGSQYMQKSPVPMMLVAGIGIAVLATMLLLKK